MERQELALKLLEMQFKLDTFWESLISVGLNPGESLLSEIDPLTIVGELYGLTSEEDDDAFRSEWSTFSERPNVAQAMLARLEKRIGQEV